MLIVGVILLAYLLGSVPFALIAGKVVAGKDIRNYGSGNLGGTNAFRVLGWKAGLAVIGADIFKGALATYLALHVSGNEIIGMLGGVAACLGHCFPVFAGFRGGKGVATGAGVFLVLAPQVIIPAAVVFAVVLALFRYVSLASIMGALAVAIFTWINRLHPILIIASWLLVAFVIYRHRSNIQRLLNGTENRVGSKNK